jgi:hypothetical protein
MEFFRLTRHYIWEDCKWFLCNAVIISHQSYDIDFLLYYYHAIKWLWMGFGVVNGIIWLIQLITTLYTSLLLVSLVTVIIGVLVTASNGGRFPSAAFPNSPRTSATATATDWTTNSQQLLHYPSFNQLPFLLITVLLRTDSSIATCMPA